ncbi:S-adenosylmethionine decarboxylase [Patescibacteria group bacterium]|nr:S-adenosylmethionine decarboxylase [Patescibacteria group bacterium]MCH8889048.1 S-adenosylmethionine decarboxylase [Patescibacteria group bacterium]
MKNYGKELIIDLHKCNPNTFNRKSIKKYFRFICREINMQPEKLVWWDDLYTPQKERETEPHLVGTSAVQFIRTSNITIHTLDRLKRVYLNIFSCKDFNAQKATSISKIWFKGEIISCTTIIRQ